jgi:cytochrome d ubiquinol oxidase subunit II
VTIDNAANESSVLVALLISIGIGMAILLPSLYYLFSVFKLSAPDPGLQKKEEMAVGEASKE